MKKTNKLLLILTLILFSAATFGQGVIKGVVLDEANGESLIGATVFLQGTTTGTTSALDGSFEFDAAAGNYTLEISFIGFSSQEMSITVRDGGTVDVGSINLATSAIGLVEVSVFADVAITRKTPVAVTSVPAQVIERELGNQEFPEIMKMTPGVYATKLGGGYGDSRINVRGFDQANVAVMINGIPVNDMENGWVYWSNWAGLSDGTRTMQVQRGLGASKLAINSIGGTLNIITRTTDAKKGGFLSTARSEYGTKKTKIGLNTGLMDNGWAVSFIGSRTEGEGYVDATWIDAWSYFLSASKQINKDHSIVFTAIGAPQKHGQRVSDAFHALSYDKYEQYGNKYNSGWGYLDGKRVLEKTNYYHKPQIALNWYWNISEKSFLSTSAYLSFGRGGGSGLLGRSYDGYYWKYDPKRSPNGWIDWNQSVDANVAAKEEGQGAAQILRNSVNSHNWIGVLSTLNHELSENLQLIAGVDLRKYKGIHYREVRDLLGADYWDDSYASYKGGNSQALVGDKIDYYNDGFVSYSGLFTQLEYAKNNLSSFLSASISNTWYRRVDYFNYDETDYVGKVDFTGTESTTESQFGYNLKTGFNYNIDDKNNFFVNAGYYSMAPKFDYIFINYSNDVNEEYAPEKVIAAEIGYGYNSRYVTARFNTYYTAWNDRWLDDYFIDPVTGEGEYAYFQGLNEVHYGIEAELQVNFSKNFRAAFQGSIGKWYYPDNVDIVLYDDDFQKVGNSTMYTANTKVVDAPQTQLGLALKWDVTKQIDLGMNVLYFDQLYSKSNLTDRQDPSEEGVDSWKIPSYTTVDFRVGFAFDLAGLDAYASCNVNNLFDTEYIVEGWDNVQRNSAGEYAHDKENFAGFWGWGRNMNFALRVNF
ncbi:MAG: TonB-dependent receptor [Bacteroidetes bacterium]|nr:TonB-dependent receptor [Bacteroidota bacterium]